MTRVKCAPSRKASHKKLLKLAKGYRGRSKNCYRIALQRVEKALQYAYRDRRGRRRDLRALWITRINALARDHGVKYSQLIHYLNLAGIELDRKILSELAVKEPEQFERIVESALRAATNAGVEHIKCTSINSAVQQAIQSAQKATAVAA